MSHVPCSRRLASVPGQPVHTAGMRCSRLLEPAHHLVPCRLRRVALACVALGGLATTPVPAQTPAPGGPSKPVAYELDAGHTRVHWEVDHMGVSTTRGRIDTLGGVVTYDAARRQVEVSITAEPASVSTGLPAFDQIMRSARLLSVEAFPAAYFTARQGSWQGERLAELSGELTLRGISRPLRLRALRFECRLSPLFRREVCGGDFEGRFLRSDFGMTLALPLVGDEVRLLVQVEGVRSE